jgi:hypothetical protein
MTVVATVTGDQVLTVIGDVVEENGATWVQVHDEASGIDGWVIYDFIESISNAATPTDNGPTASGSSTPTPDPNFLASKHFKTKQDAIVYAEPSTSSETITHVVQGFVLDSLGINRTNETEWVMVAIPGTSIWGWMQQEDLIPIGPDSLLTSVPSSQIIPETIPTADPADLVIGAEVHPQMETTIWSDASENKTRVSSAGPDHLLVVNGGILTIGDEIWVPVHDLLTGVDGWVSADFLVLYDPTPPTEVVGKG